MFGVRKNLILGFHECAISFASSMMLFPTTNSYFCTITILPRHVLGFGLSILAVEAKFFRI